MVKKLVAVFCLIYISVPTSLAQSIRVSANYCGVVWPSPSITEPVELSNATASEKEQNTTKTNIYPNPSKGVFYLTIDTEFTGNDISIEIADVSGKTVRTSKLKTQDARQVDLTGLNDGLYFVKLAVGNKITVRKVVIDRN